MYNYTLVGSTYPSCYNTPLDNHTFSTEMNGIHSTITVQIDPDNNATCDVASEGNWDLHELLNHAELLVQNTLNSIAFASGITSEVFFNHIVCNDTGIEVTRKSNYESAIKDGAPKELLQIAFSTLHQCSSEFGWHLTRSLNEFRLALRHPLDGGFYCYRSIECLRVYCRDKYNLTKDNEQWKKLRLIAEVQRSDIDKIKQFADPNRHGDFQGISGEDREKTIHLTHLIIQKFFQGIFNNERQC